jgi:hypothetical protein
LGGKGRERGEVEGGRRRRTAAVALRPRPPPSPLAARREEEGESGERERRGVFFFDVWVREKTGTFESNARRSKPEASSTIQTGG